jgi:hypothetical protein
MKKSIILASGFLVMLSIASCTNTSDKKNLNTKITGDSTNVKDVYICPMDSDVKGDKPGECPKCGMTLEKNK